jgi:hypothetical protein
MALRAEEPLELAATRIAKNRVTLELPTPRPSPTPGTLPNSSTNSSPTTSHSFMQQSMDYLRIDRPAAVVESQSDFP